MFLGFRQREAFDADLAAPFPGATSVYTWQGQGYRDYYETYFQVRFADTHPFQAPSAKCIPARLPEFVLC